MQLNAHEKELLTLVVLGAVIGLGKLLVGGERLTVRILLGRMIIGAGLSSSAGAILIMFKELEPTALIGVASAIGILGQSVLEATAQRFLGRPTSESANGDAH
ncbi:holin [Burkholderia contaminans]|uniref:holin n=1 Tax=Burkholderia contaminans TaxID=488447 RepID=UPI001453D0D0|nr:holin [Burkholderia contaminans]VWD62543.1 holin [Burkholderia contaminans]